MSGAGFILAINLVVAGLLAAAFMTIATYDRRRRSARWLAASFLLGLVYFAIEFSIPLFANARLPVLTAFAVFLGATIAFNVGLCRKYAVRVPAWPMFLFFVVATVAVYLVQDQPRHSFIRMLTLPMPYVIMQAIGLWIIAMSRNKRERLDAALMCLLGASAAAVFQQAVPRPCLRRLGREPPSLYPERPMRWSRSRWAASSPWRWR